MVAFLALVPPIATAITGAVVATGARIATMTGLRGLAARFGSSAITNTGSGLATRAAANDAIYNPGLWSKITGFVTGRGAAGAAATAGGEVVKKGIGGKLLAAGSAAGSLAWSAATVVTTALGGVLGGVVLTLGVLAVGFGVYKLAGAIFGGSEAKEAAGAVRSPQVEQALSPVLSPTLGMAPMQAMPSPMPMMQGGMIPGASMANAAYPAAVVGAPAMMQQQAPASDWAARVGGPRTAGASHVSSLTDRQSAQMMNAQQFIQ